MSAVFVRVRRDLSAVGKIPGKSQHGNAEMKNPETLPPVALRLSGACRFPVLPLHAKNYECAIFLERVFSKFGVCREIRSNYSDYQGISSLLRSFAGKKFLMYNIFRK